MQNPAPNRSSGKHVQFAIENDHFNIYFVDLPSYSFSVVMLYPLYRIENGDVPSFFGNVNGSWDACYR
jgi:hypothetical protein